LNANSGADPANGPGLNSFAKGAGYGSTAPAPFGGAVYAARRETGPGL